MKIAGKVIYYICLAFLGLVVILLFVSVLPITGNFKIKMVLSGSMEPTIKTGSLVVVKPADNYKIGDIITFQRKTDKELITHRIEDIKTEGGQTMYVTKGDSNNSADKKEVAESDVAGKVLFSIPYLGYIVSFVQKPIGFALFIIVPAFIVIIDEVKKIYVEVKKKSKNS
jgi:signal peptidase